MKDFSISDKFLSLTNREKEIVSLIIAGNSTVEIANILDLSPRTIETHKRNMFIKCRVKSSVELIVFILQNGILNQAKVA